MSTMVPTEAAKAAELKESVRDAVRDLILVLADSKRLLGMRYANWILGAPELEAGIACASMAQDEWGHGRLLYALLREFGEDVDGLEHGREPEAYCSMGALDGEPRSWPELVAINVIVDGALTVQLQALAGSAYLPLRQRVQKLLEEETFHTAHGTAWSRRLAAAGPEARAAMAAAVRATLPAAMRWFGPDSDRSHALQFAGISDGAGSSLRTRLAERVAPLAQLLEENERTALLLPDFAGFNERTRRREGTAPDERTIAQVRGDLNRAFLMD